MSLRVFELAKELNIPTRDLIKRIGKSGIKIKGNFSALSEEQIVVIKKDFLEPAAHVKETVIPAAEGVKKVGRRIISVKKASKALKIKKSLNATDAPKDAKTEPEVEPLPETSDKIDDAKKKKGDHSETKTGKEGRKIIKAKAKATTEKSEKKTAGAATKEKVLTETAKEPEKKTEEKSEKHNRETAVAGTEENVLTETEKQKKKTGAEEKSHKDRTTAKASLKKDKEAKEAKEKIDKKAAEKNKPKESKLLSKDDEDKKQAGKKKVQPLSDASSKSKPTKASDKRGKFQSAKGEDRKGQAVSGTGDARPKRPKHSRKQRFSKAAVRKEKNKRQQTNRKAKHTFNPRQKDLVVGEFIKVGDLSGLIGIKVSEIIKTLMSLGIMAAITQSIDGETAALVASEYGIQLKVEYTSIEESIAQSDDDDEEQLYRRPPVVTIMGHVDHGKTSLLDKIRKSNVTAGEAGGITQHIGAYHVKTADGKITFLDTPGHEAFTEMRARGADVTDIVILVVATDDGPKPQTIEAINHSKAANVEIMVALNKCDKPDANPDRTIQELMRYEIVPEELGGTVPIIKVSAKTGEGIDKLLEMVHLQAEMMELKAKSEGPAKGVVIESRVDMNKGNIASVLVLSGVLKVGDPYVVGTEYGRVRAMWNDQGKKIVVASPSEPVEIAGLNGTPKAGDPFNVGTDEKQVRQIAALRGEKEKEKRQAQQKKRTLENLFDRVGGNEKRVLNLIVKTDVIGSLEALTKSLMKQGNDKVSVNIIHDAVGAIVTSDVLLASTSEGIIIGFNTRPDKAAKKISQEENVDIRLYTVIYEVIEDVKNALEGMLEPVVREEIQGKAEVLHVFNIPKVGVVAGSRVVNGKILRDCSVRVIRNNVIIHNGKLASLQRFKDSEKEVSFGYECGIAVESFKDLRVGDELESYLRLTTPAKL